MKAKIEMHEMITKLFLFGVDFPRFLLKKENSRINAFWLLNNFSLLFHFQLFVIGKSIVEDVITWYLKPYPHTSYDTNGFLIFLQGSQ